MPIRGAADSSARPFRRASTEHFDPVPESEVKHIAGKYATSSQSERSLALAEYKAGVRAALFELEMSMEPVQCNDLSEPSRMFQDAGQQLDNVLELMQKVNEEQSESTGAMRELMNHMTLVSPKKMREDAEEQCSVVLTAREKLIHIERILVEGHVAEATALLTQIVEFQDPEEQALAPMLQTAPSSIQEAAEANFGLGEIASAAGKAAIAETYYQTALNLFKQCEKGPEQAAFVSEAMAQLLWAVLEQEESLTEDGKIAHCREEHEELLRGLVLDSALLVQQMSGYSASSLKLLERTMQAQVSLGKWNAARLLCDDVVDAASEVHEHEPHKLAAVMARAASLLTSNVAASSAETVEQALQLSEKAMKLVKATDAAENQVGTLLQCCSVAAAYVELKRHSEAKAILGEAIPLLSKALGASHVSLAYVLRDCAEANLALGLILEAKSMFKQAHIAMKQNVDCFGEDDILRCYNGTQLRIQL